MTSWRRCAINCSRMKLRSWSTATYCATWGRLSRPLALMGKPKVSAQRSAISRREPNNHSLVPGPRIGVQRPLLMLLTSAGHLRSPCRSSPKPGL